MVDLDRKKIEKSISYFAQQNLSWPEVAREITKRLEGISNIQGALLKNPKFSKYAKNSTNPYFINFKKQLTKISKTLPKNEESSSETKYKNK